MLDTVEGILTEFAEKQRCVDRMVDFYEFEGFHLVDGGESKLQRNREWRSRNKEHIKQYNAAYGEARRKPPKKKGRPVTGKIECGHTDRVHRAKGMCHNCYTTTRKRVKRERQREV